jgi:hypothetical protein
MTNKEEISENMAEAVAECVKRNVKIFKSVEKERKLYINNIEEMWGTTKKEMLEILDTLYNNLVNEIPEKELLEDKKKVSKQSF